MRYADNKLSTQFSLQDVLLYFDVLVPNKHEYLNIMLSAGWNNRRTAIGADTAPLAARLFIFAKIEQAAICRSVGG